MWEAFANELSAAVAYVALPTTNAPLWLIRRTLSTTTTTTRFNIWIDSLNNYNLCDEAYWAYINTDNDICQALIGQLDRWTVSLRTFGQNYRLTMGM